jgi:hypothetical protein
LHLAGIGFHPLRDGAWRTKPPRFQKAISSRKASSGSMSPLSLSPITSKPASRGRIKTGHSEVFNSYQVS